MQANSCEQTYTILINTFYYIVRPAISSPVVHQPDLKNLIQHTQSGRKFPIILLVGRHLGGHRLLGWSYSHLNQYIFVFRLSDDIIEIDCCICPFESSIIYTNIVYDAMLHFKNNLSTMPFRVDCSVK